MKARIINTGEIINVKRIADGRYVSKDSHIFEYYELDFNILGDEDDTKQRIIHLIKMSSEFGGLALHKWEADEMLAWIEKHSSSQTKENNPLKQSGKKASYTTIVETGDGGINALVKRELPTEMKSAEESLGIDSDTYNKVVDECIFGERKPKENKGNIGGISSNWSVENRSKVQRICKYLNEAKKYYADITEVRECIDWLHSLQDRLQPKQEWSEEDEKIINGLIDSLTRISLNTRTDSTSPNYTFYKEIDWLKSLRPQNHLKPSYEQIKVCKEVYADILSAKGFDLGTVNDELNRMEEELKKLKE